MPKAIEREKRLLSIRGDSADRFALFRFMFREVFIRTDGVDIPAGATDDFAPAVESFLPDLGFHTCRTMRQEFFNQQDET